MNTQRVHQSAYVGILVLSAIALSTVVVGYLQGAGPSADEGALAHIFQLAIVSLAPIGLALLATADWRQPWKLGRRLILPAALVTLAFVGLYHIEHR